MDALKNLLAKLTIYDRHTEMFDNYASPEDFEQYSREDLDTFFDGLLQDVSMENMGILGCATILINYKERCDATRDAAKNLKKLQADFKALREAKEKENGEHKRVYEEVKKSRDEAVRQLGALYEENLNLKKELKSQPREVDVLNAFRGTCAYYEMLNNKIFQKVTMCWKIASTYLAENLGGDMNGFIELYLAEELHLENAKNANKEALMPSSSRNNPPTSPK
ncbi:uncharacterized protein LOC141672350 [Apium graveolens]|uniref:uncharacterized protein LOC141672350 n=1 Tax=Apium graveolens TaxID=4045 RepID=UPI003D7B7BE9